MTMSKNGFEITFGCETARCALRWARTLVSQAEAAPFVAVLWLHTNHMPHPAMPEWSVHEDSRHPIVSFRPPCAPPLVAPD